MSKSSKFGLGLIFGAIAGAVAGILSAPKSGKETMKDIKSVAESFGADSEKKLKALHAQASDKIKSWESEAVKLKGSAKTESEAILKNAKKLQDRVKAYIAEVKNGDENPEDLSIDDLKAEMKNLEASFTKLSKHIVSKVKSATKKAPVKKAPSKNSKTK
jgi:gas vesicle protein